MKLLARRVLAVSSLVALAGCGGGAAPAPVTPAAKPAGTIVMPEGSVTAKAPADLSPVTAPAELFAVARLKNPGGLVDKGLNWAGLPLDWRAMLAHKSPEIARVLAPSAPIDFAMSIDPASSPDDPKPMFVVSVPVTSVDAAVDASRSKGWTVRQLNPGVYRVTHDDDECAVAAAVGPAPARVVCGDSSAMVDALLPYVTRGLPNETFTDSDLHVEFRAGPFQQRYAHELRRLKTLAVPYVLSKLQLDSPPFDRALADAVHAVADEGLALAEDLDKLSVDAWMRDDPAAIDITGSLHFKGSSSWTAQTLVDSGSRAASPPDAFWRLPADASSATWGVAPNPKRYSGMKQTLSELLDGYLSHEAVPRRARDQLVDIVGQLFSMQGAAVTAHGGLPPTSANEQASSERESLRTTLGWYVIGIDEKADRYKKLFGDLVKLYNDAQLRKMLKGLKPADLPKLTTHAAKGVPGGTAYELVIPAKLFEGMSYEPPPPPDAPPGKKPSKKPAAAALSVSLVLVADGDRTWIGLSSDADLLAKKLGQVRKTNDPQSLGSREGLGLLKAAKAVSGGYVTMAGFMESSAVARELGGNPAQALQAVPHHGETPMPYTLSVAQDSGVSMMWSLHVPRAVIEDAAALAPALH